MNNKNHSKLAPCPSKMIWNHHHGYWPSNTESTKLSYITVVFLLCKPLTPANRTSANFLHEKPSCTEENLIHLPVVFFFVSGLYPCPTSSHGNLLRWSLVFFWTYFLGVPVIPNLKFGGPGMSRVYCNTPPPPPFCQVMALIFRNKRIHFTLERNTCPRFNKQRYTNHSINHPINHNKSTCCLKFSQTQFVFSHGFFRCFPPWSWVSEFHPPETETTPPTSTRSGTGGAVHENRPPSSSSSKSKSMKWRPLQKQNDGRSKLFWGKIMVDSFFFGGGKVVGGWTNPSWKIWVKMGSSSPNRDENIQCLKPPPSFLFGGRIVVGFYSICTWCFFLPVWWIFHLCGSCGSSGWFWGFCCLFVVLATRAVIMTHKINTPQNLPDLSHWPQHRRIQRQQPCDARWSAMPCGSTSAWTPEFDRPTRHSVRRIFGRRRSSMISEGRNKNSKSLFLSGEFFFKKKYLCKTKKLSILPSSWRMSY